MNRHFPDGSPSPATAEGSTFFDLLLRMLADAVCQEHVGGAAAFYRRVAKLAAERAGSSGGSLFLVESDGGGLIEVAIHDPRELRVPGRRFARAEGVAGAALESGQTEWHTSAVPHTTFVATDTTVHDILALPLVAPGQSPCGVLCVHNFRDPARLAAARDELDTWKVALAHALRLVRAADNLQAINRRLREENERVVQLHALAALVSDEAPATEVAEAMLRDLARLYGFERSSLVVERSGESICLAARGFPERFRAGNRITRGAMSGDPLVECLDEVLGEHRLVVRADETAALVRGSRAPLQAIVGLPLRCEDGFRGAVLLASGWGDAPRVDDVDPAPAQCYLDQAMPELARSLKAGARA